MSSSVSARAHLQKAVRDSSPDSLDSVVARYLLSCVERFGEGAFGDAIGIADFLLDSFCRSGDITRFNDAFRCTHDPEANGQLVITAGVQGLGKEIVNTALSALREFDDFTKDNDPYCEHDFGSFEAAEHRFFWKFDYYDLDFQLHSPNPADPKVTRRVLTLMLPEEY